MIARPKGKLARIIWDGLRKQRQSSAEVKLRDLHTLFIDIRLYSVTTPGCRESWVMEIGGKRGAVRFTRTMWRFVADDSVAVIEKAHKALIEEADEL